ncbi:MAG: hypothetical protein IPL75_22460 [Acidobacteria bacterium]|nr:hypothetical protein [Acidobacteriota bacterium]
MRSEGLRKLTVRVLAVGCVTVAALLVSAAPASAQWRVGPFIGGEHESSWDEFLVIGADARGAVGTQNMELNPRFTYFVRDLTTRFQMDFNVIKRLEVASTSRIEPYVGTGLAFERISYDGNVFDNESALGFNYIVGATVKSSGRMQAFAQFVYTVLHDSANNAVVSAGVHFKLSK